MARPTFGILACHIRQNLTSESSTRKRSSALIVGAAELPVNRRRNLLPGLVTLHFTAKKRSHGAFPCVAAGKFGK